MAESDNIPSGFEVFIAEDGEPAIRMTAERQVASLQGQINRWREVIEGYKQTQDELQDENIVLRNALRRIAEYADNGPRDDNSGTMIDANTIWGMATEISQ